MAFEEVQQRKRDKYGSMYAGVGEALRGSQGGQDLAGRREAQDRANLLRVLGTLAPVAGTVAGAGIGAAVGGGAPGAAIGAGIGGALGGAGSSLAEYGAQEQMMPYTEHDMERAQRMQALQQYLMMLR